MVAFSRSKTSPAVGLEMVVGISPVSATHFFAHARASSKRPGQLIDHRVNVAPTLVITSVGDEASQHIASVVQPTLTSDLYGMVSQLADKGVEFKVLDDPSIDTSSRIGKLVMGILALIAEFENDIRRERQMDGIKKAHERGVRFGRKPLLVVETVQKVKKLRKAGKTVPEIMRQTSLSKASVYRALAASPMSA